ncbi:MAG: hypothetical protein ACJAZQ_002037 [Cognaticolwellia sp.]|jgi:hypothetical protein
MERLSDGIRNNVIDAFTDVPFKNNLAAVIITNDWLSVEPSFRTNPKLYNELILLIQIKSSSRITNGSQEL